MKRCGTTIPQTMKLALLSLAVTCYNRDTAIVRLDFEVRASFNEEIDKRYDPTYAKCRASRALESS